MTKENNFIRSIVQKFAKREGKNGPATVPFIPTVVNAFATDFVAFHRACSNLAVSNGTNCRLDS